MLRKIIFVSLIILLLTTVVYLFVSRHKISAGQSRIIVVVDHGAGYWPDGAFVQTSKGLMALQSDFSSIEGRSVFSCDNLKNGNYDLVYFNNERRIFNTKVRLVKDTTLLVRRDQLPRYELASVNDVFKDLKSNDTISITYNASSCFGTDGGMLIIYREGKDFVAQYEQFMPIGATKARPLKKIFPPSFADSLQSLAWRCAQKKKRKTFISNDKTAWLIDMKFGLSWHMYITRGYKQVEISDVDVEENVFPHFIVDQGLHSYSKKYFPKQIGFGDCVSSIE